MKADLHSGMKTRNPPASDKSTRLPGHSIDSEATRKGVAATPPTLGPRTA